MRGTIATALLFSMSLFLVGCEEMKCGLCTCSMYCGDDAIGTYEERLSSSNNAWAIQERCQLRAERSCLAESASCGPCICQKVACMETP
jgi:hypothetical protein